jgi:hypothetical protein
MDFILALCKPESSTGSCWLLVWGIDRCGADFRVQLFTSGAWRFVGGEGAAPPPGPPPAHEPEPNSAAGSCTGLVPAKAPVAGKGKGEGKGADKGEDANSAEFIHWCLSPA